MWEQIGKKIKRILQFFLTFKQFDKENLKSFPQRSLISSKLESHVRQLLLLSLHSTMLVETATNI